MRKIALLISVIAGFFVAGDAYAKEKESGGASEYVKMDPLVLPILDNDGVYQILNLVIVIEVGGINDADKVKAKKIRLNDAYIQNMYGMLNEYDAIRHGIIQVGVIKDRLNIITSEMMGDDVHTEVLLQVVQQRPI